jgi:hypothetical protein
MVVYKRKGTKHYFMDFCHEGKRIRKKIPTTRKDLAQQYERDYRNKLLRQEIGLEQPDVALSSLIERYLKFSQTNNAPTTFKRGEFSLRTFRDLSKVARVSEITPLLMEKYKADGVESVAGEAARAAAWSSPYHMDRMLILKELTDTGTTRGKELHLPVEGAFELKDIPADTYEARAYLAIMFSPEPVPYFYLHPDRRCQAKFVSEPQIVRVVAGQRAAVHLTISEACAPHYPIPDAATCDGGATWVLAE